MTTYSQTTNGEGQGGIDEGFDEFVMSAFAQHTWNLI